MRHVCTHLWLPIAIALGPPPCRSCNFFCIILALIVVLLANIFHLSIGRIDGKIDRPS